MQSFYPKCDKLQPANTDNKQKSQQCQWQVCRLCFGKGLHIYIYIYLRALYKYVYIYLHIYIQRTLSLYAYMKNSIPKYNFLTVALQINVFGLVLIAFQKRGLQIIIERFRRTCFLRNTSQFFQIRSMLRRLFYGE